MLHVRRETANSPSARCRASGSALLHSPFTYLSFCSAGLPTVHSTLSPTVLALVSCSLTNSAQQTPSSHAQSLGAHELPTVCTNKILITAFTEPIDKCRLFRLRIGTGGSYGNSRGQPKGVVPRLTTHRETHRKPDSPVRFVHKFALPQGPVRRVNAKPDKQHLHKEPVAQKRLLCQQRARFDP
jgi:hypothetical protein